MNEKHFGVRMPMADFAVLALKAKRDRSTVAQQVRQAVAEYVERERRNELQALNDFADLCVELDDYLPVTLREALAKIRSLDDVEDTAHNANVTGLAPEGDKS